MYIALLSEYSTAFVCLNKCTCERFVQVSILPHPWSSPYVLFMIKTHFLPVC